MSVYSYPEAQSLELSPDIVALSLKNVHGGMCVLPVCT